MQGNSRCHFITPLSNFVKLNTVRDLWQPSVHDDIIVIATEEEEHVTPSSPVCTGALLTIIFSPVDAGMMVFISLKELLPMAYKFDHTRSHVVIPIFLVVGMVVMAASLLLFLY